jgi:hypothetical protein
MSTGVIQLNEHCNGSPKGSIDAKTTCDIVKNATGLDNTPYKTAWFRYTIPFMAPEITDQFDQIKSIDLDFIKNLDNEAVWNLLEYFTEIQELKIGSCYKLSDKILDIVRHRCRKITKLSLPYTSQYFSRSATKKLIYSYPDLTHLDLSNNSSYSLFLKNPFLDIKGLSESCPKLESINFSHCSFVNNLSEISKLANLTELSLHFMHIPTAQLKSLSECLSGIRVLDLGYTSWYQAVDFHDLIPLMQNVEVLDIEHSNALSGENVVAISKHCKKLKVLNLSINDQILNNYFIEPKHLKCLLELPCLEKLEIHSCRIDQATLEAFMNRGIELSVYKTVLVDQQGKAILYLTDEYLEQTYELKQKNQGPTGPQGD